MRNSGSESEAVSGSGFREPERNEKWDFPGSDIDLRRIRIRIIISPYCNDQGHREKQNYHGSNTEMT